MLKLMSMVNAQSQAEEQPSAAWLRAWFPCIKQRNRQAAARGMSLTSPLLSSSASQSTINTEASSASSSVLDGDDGIGANEDPMVLSDAEYAQRHGRYIALAASRVRDAMEHKYRSLDWGSMRKLNAKRFFHQTKFFRGLIMVCWFLLAFVEVPAWCFQVPEARLDFASCLNHVPNFGIPLLKKSIGFSLDFVCLAVIGGELFLKIRFSGKRSFHGNRWYILQILLLSIYLTSFLVVFLVPTCPVNLCPIIRPLYFLSLIHI